MAEYYRDKYKHLAKLVKNAGEGFKIVACIPNTGVVLLRGSYSTRAKALEALATATKTTWTKTGED